MGAWLLIETKSYLQGGPMTKNTDECLVTKSYLQGGLTTKDTNRCLVTY